MHCKCETLMGQGGNKTKKTVKKLPLLLFDISIVVIGKNLFQKQDQESGRFRENRFHAETESESGGFPVDCSGCRVLTNI